MVVSHCNASLGTEGGNGARSARGGDWRAGTAEQEESSPLPCVGAP